MSPEPGETFDLDYDDDGNLIQKDGIGYTFNGENRLIEVKPLVPQAADTKVTFAYDYQGRRFKKTVATWSGSDWSESYTVAYLYDGWNNIEETTTTASSGSQATKAYVWGLDLSQSLQGAGGVGGLLATISNNETDFHLFDANGNVGQLVNATDGSVQAHYEYDPFGRTMKAVGPKAEENTYRFSTKPLDVETGLYVYTFRYLSVDLGRWWSRDPMEENGDSPNLQLFVENQALIFIDPYGLAKQNISCAGTCGAIADDWMRSEIKSQIIGWTHWKHQQRDWYGRPKSITIEDYLKWANGNQRYKDRDFFQFSKDTPCGTHDKKNSSVGCGFSVTLCGQCVKSAILGNIMYGFVGRLAGFTDQELKSGATSTKKKWRRPVDQYDEMAYGVGASLFDTIIASHTGGSSPFVTLITSHKNTDYCMYLNTLLQNSPDALKQGNDSGGYDDMTTCKPCTIKTNETRHGGKEPSRMRP